VVVPAAVVVVAPVQVRADRADLFGISGFENAGIGPRFCFST
jgi:hypothetical protein